MSIFRPIPRKLLPHTITYEEYIGGDGWENDYAPPITINHVRVEPSTYIKRSANQEEILAKNIVFIDRVNSSPFTIPKQKGKVTFNGEEYEVHKVNPFYAVGTNIHYLEVELV